jgi:hypothetical protein
MEEMDFHWIIMTINEYFFSTKPLIIRIERNVVYDIGMIIDEASLLVHCLPT